MPTDAPEGTLTVTPKVHVSPGCNSPPLNVKKLVPEIEELTPQGFAGREPEVCKPEITEVKLSENDIDDAASAFAEFESVYSSTVVLFGNTGSVKNVFVAVNPEINRSWLTAAFTTELLLTVALTLLVVKVTVPLGAEFGIFRETEKLHESPGAKEPPAKVTVEVPDKLEPMPHISL